jgi:hypothetical protein
MQHRLTRGCAGLAFQHGGHRSTRGRVVHQEHHYIPRTRPLEGAARLRARSFSKATPTQAHSGAQQSSTDDTRHFALLPATKTGLVFRHNNKVRMEFRSHLGQIFARAPGLPEFLRFISNKEGQQAVLDEAIFLPLRAKVASQARTQVE